MPRCKWHLDWDRHTGEMMRLVNEVGLSTDHPSVRQAQRRSVAALAFAARADDRDGGGNDYCTFETAEERAERMGGTS
jgi:hypothetical protein